jgi:hypothetical protein
MTTNFFSPLLFLGPGSGMGKNQDPGSWINIPDPPHWLWITLSADPDPESQTDAHPDMDPVQTLPSQNVEFLHLK